MIIVKIEAKYDVSLSDLVELSGVLDDIDEALEKLREQGEADIVESFEVG